jgi:ferric-dicitrate binding protein FerR (iron transport regulator)
MDFTHYSINDFVADESFQAYVADANSEAGRFWQSWLATHPTYQADADQAYALVQGLGPYQLYPVPAGLKQQELLRLRQALGADSPRPWLRWQRRTRLLVGSSVVAMLAAVGWWQWPATTGPTTQYAAGPSQQRTLTLPDGSVVVLNGRATLTTAARWTATTPREVWLTGEAYFRVTHRAAPAVRDIAAAPASAKFVVHAGGLDIAVLGTQFDVNSQPTGTKVVLSSGKVAVDRRAWLTTEKVLMQPGDLVETSEAAPHLARRHVQPALYSAWTQGELRLQQTSVRDIVQLLRDAYGWQVVATDPALLNQTLTGILPANTPDLLLPALAKTLGVRVSRTGNVVRFQPLAR